ncbi:MAG: hypothetical protein ABI954_02010, partial [Pyrinomonadaceae bacterium]
MRKAQNYLTFSLAVFLLASTGAGIVVAQQKDVQSPQKNQLSDQEKQKQQLITQDPAMRLSLTIVDQDEGYSITTIKRVKHTYRRFLNNVATDNIMMEVVIELHTPRKLEIVDSTNAPPSKFFLIGDKVIDEIDNCPSDEQHCFNLFLKPEQFEQLKDNSIISFCKKYNVSSLDLEALKEMYKDGEPREVLGIKFGRLNKKLINQFP